MNRSARSFLYLLKLQRIGIYFATIIQRWEEGPGSLVLPSAKGGIRKMAPIPERIHLANLPTKIEKLERLSRHLGGPDIYVKRDDQTGSEISGNKVRKNEFLLKEAMDSGCSVLITCGGVQSNHARSTAALAVKLGFEAHLVLKSDTACVASEGNYFLNQLLGAKIKLISPDDYAHRRDEIMDKIKAQLAKEGKKAYVIPEGASSGLGLFGYYLGMEEIIKQQSEMGLTFDAIVVAVGSGGTFGGLFLGNELMNSEARVYGFNVCKDKAFFQSEIEKLLCEASERLGRPRTFKKDEFLIIDGYVGDGYALSRREELDFIRRIARLEGLILDPVYTGKAMLGLVTEIEKGTFKDHRNVLFIHTGGLFGLFPKKNEFVF